MPYSMANSYDDRGTLAVSMCISSRSMSEMSCVAMYLDRICEKAERLGNVPVWIDMENSPYVDPTLALLRASKAKYKGVGVAMQAYLYRTAKDVEGLIPLGPAIRIVKGAYL